MVKKTSYCVLQAPYALQLSRDTTFIEAEEANENMPHYFFEFAEYNSLSPGAKNNALLTGEKSNIDIKIAITILTQYFYRTNLYDAVFNFTKFS